MSVVITRDRKLVIDVPEEFREGHAEVILLAPEDPEVQMAEVPSESAGDVEDADFWASDVGRITLTEADDSIPMEDILKATSSIKGSLAAEAIAERDEE